MGDRCLPFPLLGRQTGDTHLRVCLHVSLLEPIKRREMKKPKLVKKEPYPRRTVPCKWHDDPEQREKNRAKLILSPEFSAMRVVAMAQPKDLADTLDLPAMLDTLREQAKAVEGGDLTQIEVMLVTQALALQTLFVRLTEKGFEQTVMSNMEPLLKLAMRAQGQCRATVETLAQIKYPQALVITRQANIAHGHQQVNNGVAHEVSGIEQNQVKGGTDGQWMDTRAQEAAERTDPVMATLATVHRTQDTGRQESQRNEGIQGRGQGVDPASPSLPAGDCRTGEQG